MTSDAGGIVITALLRLVGLVTESLLLLVVAVVLMGEGGLVVMRLGSLSTVSLVEAAELYNVAPECSGPSLRSSGRRDACAGCGVG